MKLFTFAPAANALRVEMFLREKNIKLDSVSNNEYLTKGNNINKIDILFKKIEKNND